MLNSLPPLFISWVLLLVSEVEKLQKYRALNTLLCKRKRFARNFFQGNDFQDSLAVLLCLIILCSKSRFLNTSEQLCSVLADIRGFCISSYLPGFSTFSLDSYIVSFRSVLSIAFDSLGQSTLPILSSEIAAITAINAARLQRVKFTFCFQVVTWLWDTFPGLVYPCYLPINASVPYLLRLWLRPVPSFSL